jgi:hypothetical protein
MKTTDAERLAKVILENSSTRTIVQDKPVSQRSPSKMDEEKLRLARRLFDQKYSITTPRELMKL